MKKYRQILALLLTIVLVCTAVPFDAYSAYIDDGTDIDDELDYTDDASDGVSLYSADYDNVYFSGDEQEDDEEEDGDDYYQDEDELSEEDNDEDIFNSAEESDDAEEIVVIGEPPKTVTESFEDVVLPDSNELLEGYIEQTFEEETGVEVDLSVDGEEPDTRSPIATVSDILHGLSVFRVLDVSAASSVSSSIGQTVTRGSKLSGNDLIMYNYLAERIKAIAAGEVPSTEIEVPVTELLGDKLSYTKEELGVDTIIENNSITKAAMTAFYNKISYNTSTVLRALLCDSPYDFYWYDKTSGTTFSTPGCLA